MVIPNPNSKPLEVRGEDGQVIAYLVPAEQMARLQAEAEDLRAQIAALQKQKQRYASELADVLKTSLPFPPTEEEMASATDNSHEIRKIIADLESR